MIVEQRIEGVAGVAEFGHDERIGRDLGDGDVFLRGERMTRGGDDD